VYSQYHKVYHPVSKGKSLIRVTIVDQDQTISFLANPETLRRLIAACSAGPANIGELLIAVDIYQRGIAAAIMADLMEFDKSLHQNGDAAIQASFSQARTAPQDSLPAFQVVDAITAQAAYDPGGGELVAIDLTSQTIRHSAGIVIARSGEVKVEAADKSPLPSVTYILPEKWAIQPL
jgi:hypothetical protein